MLDKLRKISWQGLSGAEKKELLKKLKLYEQGKLSREQIDALFKKLRVTADYFAKNKERLEKELEEYVAGKSIVKKPAKPARKK